MNHPTTEVDYNDGDLATSVANVRISVVIPVRNRELTLTECIESVLTQTLPPTEVIVVDDASTDATVKIASTYAGRGVDVIQLSHRGGAQTARNAGIRAATGDWIAFQDSDDIWVAEKLARQVEALSQRSFDQRTVVYSDYVQRDMASRSASRVWLPYQAGECYSSLLVRSGPPFPSLLTSRESLMRIGLLDEECPAYQEWDTAIRLAKIGFLVHLREPLFEWRWHDGEAISKDKTRRFRGFEYVIQKHRAEIVRLHGEAIWATLDLQNLAVALYDGLYDEILETFGNETNGTAHDIVRFFARKGICPPGVGRFLRLIAAISTWKQR